MAQVNITEEMVEALSPEDARVLIGVIDGGDPNELLKLSDAGREIVFGAAGAETEGAEPPGGKILNPLVSGAEIIRGAARSTAEGLVESGGLPATEAIPVVTGTIGAGVGRVAGGPAGELAGGALGAGAGEAAVQIGQRSGVLKGDAPDTSSEAARRIGERMAEAVFADVAIMTGAGFLKSATPATLRVFAEMNHNAVTRSMERANDVLLVAGKDFTQASVERRGMSGIKKLWESSSAHRKFLGKQVDEGLKAVEKKTGGKAVFNLDAAAKDALDELPDFSRMTDEEFALLKKVDPSVEKLRNVLDSINTNPNKTATQAIEMRRLLDDLTDWTTSTSQIPANIPSQRAMRKLAKGIREETSRWAAATGDTKLLKANKRFASHAKTHEALLEFVPLRSDTELAALNSFEKAKLAFNKGGSRHEILADIVDDIPGGEDALNEVFDAAAAFPFTQLPKGTPSGAAKDMIRLLASPKNARAGILAAHNVRNLLRATAQAGASGLGFGGAAAGAIERGGIEGFQRLESPL